MDSKVQKDRIKHAIKTMEKVVAMGIDYNQRYRIQSNFTGFMSDKIVRTLQAAKKHNIGLCFSGVISRTQKFTKAGGSLTLAGYPEFCGISGGVAAMNEYFGFDTIPIVEAYGSNTPEQVIDFLKNELENINA